MEPEPERMTWLMTVSRNGQVSIPAPIRARWQADKVHVIDMGERIVIVPHRDDAIARLRGKYEGLLPSTTEMRRRERAGEE